MTFNEALHLRSFRARCTCGGYAQSMNRRPQRQPHMYWCLQHGEYQAWYEALRTGTLEQRRQAQQKFGLPELIK